MPRVREIIIYIHGVSQSKRGRSHHDEYVALHEGVGERRPDWPEDFIGVEWGWNHERKETPTSHELLTQAQHTLASRMLPAVRQPSDFTLNLLRVAVNGFRSLMLYGFADMFYYVSKDGKYAVRLAAAEQIFARLNASVPADDDSLLSLTLLGHSAGSVVAFDLLFELFCPKEVADQHMFIDLDAVENPAAGIRALTALQRFRAMADEGRLRVRRLFTFGSPIAAMAFRSDALLAILSRSDVTSNRINPADYGLTRNPPAFGLALEHPRWVNIWDRDDPIAWPVEPLMLGAGTIVRDEYVDLSDDPTSAHDEYWRDSGVQRAIAGGW